MDDDTRSVLARRHVLAFGLAAVGAAFLVLALIIIAMTGATMFNIILVLGFVAWPGPALRNSLESSRCSTARAASRPAFSRAPQDGVRYVQDRIAAA